MASDVITLEDRTFQQEVLQSSTPVLVDFWAEWCGPCKALAPVVDALAAKYRGKLKVAKMNVEQHQEVPQQFGVRHLPTLLLFKGGRVVDMVENKSQLEEAVRKVIG